MSETYPLIQLEAENILRLKSVSVRVPRTGALIVEGRNEQGKSSVLRLADLLLAGARAGEDPIHGNEEEGTVSGQLGPYTITRRFRRGGSPVLTIREEGKRARLKAPQTILNEFVDFLSVDPMKFARMEADKQLAVISKLVGFDPAPYLEKRKAIYDERTAIGRDVTRLEGELSGVPQHADAPEREVTVNELAAELEQRRKHNEQGTILETVMRDARAKTLKVTADIGSIDDEIRRADDALRELRKERERLDVVFSEAAREAQAAMSAAAAFESADESEILEKMQSAEEINRKVRDNARRAEVLKKHRDAATSYERHTEQLKQIDAEMAKARRAAADKLAIPGLDITDTGIIYNGKPFSQAGMSATIRVSTAVAIAAAAEKPVKLLTIDEAQALDQDNLASVIEQANSAGFQVMMARNGKGDEPGTITIDDGRVS